MTTTTNPYAPPTSDVSGPSRGHGTGVAAPELWNPNAAGLWSLLFTPIFGSILLLKNWGALGRRDKLGPARVWLTVSILMLIPSALYVGLGLLYIVVWYFAWQKPQAVYVAEQWGSDYPRRSWTAPLLIAFGVWLALVVVIGSVTALAILAGGAA